MTGLVNGSNHTKGVSLSNQNVRFNLPLIQPKLHSNKYSQEFHYYSYAVSIYRCVGNCNTVNGLSNKLYAPNKTEDLNLSVFNKMTGTNELKTLTKHISCECKCRFDGRKCKSDQR